VLFNSYIFVLAFLPLTFAIYHLCRAAGADRGAIFSLVAASLFFYGWWSLSGLALLLALMAANFVGASWLATSRKRHGRLRQIVLFGAIAANLAVLAYFKYANFFLENWASLTSGQVSFVGVALPLGISFFTFQKIALMVDAYNGKVERLNALDYTLFVSFFPQLIAGPIVHHAEVMPQFASRRVVTSDDIARGITIFSIGLAKKVLIADTVAQFASPVFDVATTGQAPSFGHAWIGALAYTLQLYFDFSGYSDMAIGAALLFGVRLPVNFASPYKATSIIEFWRRWHITLSRFLRDYLYVPLGGNRHGSTRQYLNLMVTMLLGGLWHGAGWTFVLWGALHGLYLGVNHGWRVLREVAGFTFPANAFHRVVAGLVTFVAIVVAWVIFRAPDLASARLILSAMAGLGGTSQPVSDAQDAALLIAALLAFVWLLPNTTELFGDTGNLSKPVVIRSFASLRWTPSPAWAVCCGAVLAVILMSLSRVTEFLYFQF
jgi:D-alanyl-lipoteichoic acid acyltransferase DltB (MBOAT superfamily)